MQNITENLRKTNITVSLHEKNNIYQAVINYKDGINKRKQKWVSTGIKVVRGNKRIAMQKAEELREKFETTYNLQNRIKQENDEQSRKYMLFRQKLNNIDSSNNYDENILYFDYLNLWIEKVKTNLEPTTYTSHLQMINKSLDYAFKNDLIVNNPADKVKRPKKIFLLLLSSLKVNLIHYLKNQKMIHLI